MIRRGYAFALAAATAVAFFPAAASARTPQPAPIAPGQVVEWSLAKGGDGATYRVGALTLRLNATPPPEPGESLAAADKVWRTPILTLDAPGRAPLSVAGVEGDTLATARFAAGKLDPEAPGLQVVFASDTDGLNCCTTYKVVEEDAHGPGWTVLDVGTFAGPPLAAFPRDVDGDGAPDFVFGDDAFNYAFCGYDCSAPPDLAYPPFRSYEVRGGRVWDTTRARRHRRELAGDLSSAYGPCVGAHENGACAGFVAAAARLGRRAWAWNLMLPGYAPGHGVGVATARLPHTHLQDQAPVRNGQKIVFQRFPDALEAFLVRHCYMKASQAQFSASIPADPSFRCDRRLGAVEQRICDTRALRIADLDLVYVYAGALADSADRTALDRTQAAWLRRRDAARPDVRALLKLYAERTKALAGGP